MKTCSAAILAAIMSLAGTGVPAATMIATGTGNDPFPDAYNGFLSLAKCDTETDGARSVLCNVWEDGNSSGDYGNAFTLTYTSTPGGYSFDWTYNQLLVTGVADALYPKYLTVKQAKSHYVWELADEERFAGSINTNLKDISHVSFYGTAAMAAVPLPAAGWLLLAGLGGLAALRRRKS